MIFVVGYRPRFCNPEKDSLIATDVSTTCVEVIFRVNVRSVRQFVSIVLEQMLIQFSEC